MKKTAAVFFLVLAAFFPIYDNLFARFTARDTYYSHGFLVPFVVAYLIYRKRKELAALPPDSCPWGLALLVPGLLVYLAALVLKINFIAYFSLLPVLAGTALYLRGVKFTGKILFPIVFLVFMLPLPQVMIIGVAFKLKILVAAAATFLGRLSGMQVALAGSTINYPGGSLLVGDPCSGLRSLISFLALGALCTQFTDASLARKSALFLSTVPLALLSNILRITFLLFVAYIYGEKAATGLVHDISGYMVFVLGFAGLVLIAKLIRCRITV